MKLYGSTTSPYVRRLRLLLADTPHEFVGVNIFAAEDREEVKKVNPVMKVPMLEDPSNSSCPFIYDSGVIAQYVLEKNNQPALSFAKLNDLSIINALNDSLINMMLLSRSDIDTTQDKLYFNLQSDRMGLSFELLAQYVEEGRFSQWDYVAMSLVVLLEWTLFRNLYDLSKYPSLLTFVEQSQSQPFVKETAPKD